jgi:hypothetical protein
MSIHNERQQILDKMLKDAEAELAAMHPVKRWIGWKLFYLKEALASDPAVRIYLKEALRWILGVDLYLVPHSFGARSEWEAPRDIRLIAWHPMGWALMFPAVGLMILTGGIEMVHDNGNPFKKRRWHR